jgi:thymidylate synthase (FAD)
MKIIKAGYKILSEISEGGIKELQIIENVGRVCYKSEDRITSDGESAKKFVAGLIKRGHEAMLEHSSLSVLFTVDRGVSHELVRHRLFSFAQESTRYCNYGQGKFGNELTFIEPCFWPQDDRNTVLRQMWYASMLGSEQTYLTMMQNGAQAQEARSVLPNSLKTEVTITGNYREWRHFFNLRACDSTGPAHPQMGEVAKPLLIDVASRISIIFDDLAAKLK